MSDFVGSNVLVTSGLGKSDRREELAEVGERVDERIEHIDARSDFGVA